MKVIYIPKKIFINVIVVFFIVLVSVIYSVGGGFRHLNVFLNSQNKIPINCVETDKKVVALTFDTASGSQYTNQILKILEKNNIKATFFLVGSWIDRHEEVVKQIYAQGHDIGNHSSTHPHFTQLTSQKIKEEIFTTSGKIKNVTGRDIFLFRLPFGDYNGKVLDTVTETGNYCVQWDINSGDSEDLTKAEIFNNVVKKAGNGSIILFHTNSSQTSEALDDIIGELKKQGYSFALVSNMIYKDNYYIDYAGRQRRVN